jgi:hypothetical protein
MYHKLLIDKLSAGLTRISLTEEGNVEYFENLLRQASDVLDHDPLAITLWVGDVAFHSDPVGFALFLRSCGLDIS